MNLLLSFLSLHLASENTSQAFAGFAHELTSLHLGFLTDAKYFGNTLWQYLLFSIVFIASFIAAKIIFYLLKTHLKRVAERTKTRLDDMVIKVIQGPLVLGVIIIGLSFGIQLLTLPLSVLSFLSTVFSVLISLTILWFIIRFVDVLIDEYLRPVAIKTEGTLDDELVPMLKKILRALILIFGLISIASNFGYDITALITGLGIGGIAVALAAQDTLGNMFGGLSIFLDRPFAIGDRVRINEKIYGDVVDVGFRSSKIKNLDNNIIVIPNSVISKSVIENYVRPSKKIKQTFKIGLTYDTPPEKVEEAVKIIKRSIKGVEGVTNDEPLVWFTEFGDFSLNLLCIYWIRSLDYWGTTKHEINLRILKGLSKAGIEIAYPTQTLYIQEGQLPGQSK